MCKEQYTGCEGCNKDWSEDYDPGYYHPCPYESEINNDYATQCNCCPSCESLCNDEI